MPCRFYFILFYFCIQTFVYFSLITIRETQQNA